MAEFTTLQVNDQVSPGHSCMLQLIIIVMAAYQKVYIAWFYVAYYTALFFGVCSAFFSMQHSILLRAMNVCIQFR